MSANLTRRDIIISADRGNDVALRRLLEYALRNDPAGPRLRQTPPKDTDEIINQLSWLGVI